MEYIRVKAVVSHPDAALPARVVSEPGIRALRTALQAQLRESPDGDLRRTVCVVCDEARRANLHAEQLIVACKRAWQSLPEVQRLEPTRRRELLDGIVTMCVQEFYAPPRAHG